jgi:hypothetical protein
MTCVLQDEETQKKGFVLIIYAVYTEGYSREGARPSPQLLLKLGKVNRAIPMKCRGRHLCTSAKMPGMIFSQALSFLEKADRMRFRVHSGTGWQMSIL